MDPYAAEFWEFTRAGEFRLQRCTACSKFRWPAAPVCDECLSESYEWALASGAGTVLSWVTFHRRYFSEYPPPHQVVTIELDEGPIFVTTPVDLDNRGLADGMRMELAWQEATDRHGDYQLPVFRPSTTA